MEWIASYQTTVMVLGSTGFLIWLQLVVMDVASIKAKHTPGYAIEQNHSSFLFRASRAFANSNETIGILILSSLFAMLSAANPEWVNASAAVYLAGRVGHMLCYYTNLKLVRSFAFTVSFVALLSIFMAGLWVYV